MALVKSFAPLVSPGARILILGSMPGEASLKAHQYYAHPQNQFWKIMERLIGVDRQFPYAKRVRLIQDNNIAMWDVLQYCEREGSLDSAIFNEIANDFNGLIRNHPSIRHVFFNGGKAESAFNKLVKPTLNASDLEFTRLPSTSPAHASRNFEEKCAAWSVILNFLSADRIEITGQRARNLL